jgi:hypothetical protein
MKHMTALFFLLVFAASTLSAQQPSAQDSRSASDVFEVKIQRSLDPASNGIPDQLPAFVADKLVLRYSLHNPSKADMQLGAVTLSNAIDCKVFVAYYPDSAVSAGGETSMILEIAPTEGGLLSFIVNTTVDGQPYDFEVQATIVNLKHSVSGGKRHNHCSTGASTGWALIAGIGATLAVLMLRRATVRQQRPAQNR